MENKPLYIHNSLSRKKEVFKPVMEGRVGLYVCGPTVYNHVHLGNCRTLISFDIIYRHLQYLGYQVRYVRNITDMGHLEGDADMGREDKISKMARVMQLQPMQIVQKYTLSFHEVMAEFNALPPDIEPRATGHVLEQIEMVQQILDNGYGYVVNGSVYFDTMKLVKEGKGYGDLSGRVIDELLVESRDDLKNQSDKRHPSDFAIWIKTGPKHLQRWNSPWGVGTPGWHLECSAMSTKYLGETFDIHGGGSDLKFPHHENEIAQNQGACGCQPANFWMHCGMLEMNGSKMSKSDGNYLSNQELFDGTSKHLSKAYSPMVARFFMLQAHYRSPLDLSDTALLAAEKGYRRLMEANRILQEMSNPQGSANGLDKEINDLIDSAHGHMNDDFNTPNALASLFELASKVNSIKDGHLKIEDMLPETLAVLQQTFTDFIFTIFGLKDETLGANNDDGTTEGLMDLVLEIRQNARENKNWTTSDLIRDKLKELKIVVKDGKEGSSWTKE